MTTILKKYWEFEAILFILLGAAAGFVVLTVHNTSQTTYQAQAQGLVAPNFQTLPVAITHPTITPMPTATPTPTQTPKPSAPSISPSASTTSQISSDGTMTVNVSTAQNKDGDTTYSVSVNNGPVIFSKTLSPGQSISIPYNTWSPANTYFFLQENDGSQAQVMVFNANGQAFANGQSFLDLTGVFADDVSASAFSQATGWASDNLIIIETKNSDNSEGTSYWFGVPDESVTPLATQF